MMKIKNPVLAGFHPDPSMICVDGVFYIANSTFEYFPGVSLHRSVDLANWERLPSPLRASGHESPDGQSDGRISSGNLPLLDGLGASCGVWAPNLSYHDGVFFLVFTIAYNLADDPFLDIANYISTAQNIEGPWSAPVYVNGSGFDPSLFHGGDGRLWFLNVEWDFREQGDGRFKGILLTELSRDTLRPCGPPMKILERSPAGLTEAPNLYKKDAWHYLFVAEGGTNYDHGEAVFRSRDIAGPYELSPRHPLISSRGSSSRLQKAGHASLCEGPDGRWWIAFLCSRPLKSTRRSVLGRETSIAEVRWEDGWPVLSDGGILPPSHFDGYGEQRPDTSFHCRFDGPELPPEFFFLRSPPRYSLTECPGSLRLYGGKSPVSQTGQQIVAIRQRHFSFRVDTRVHFAPESYRSMAGLLYRYDERNQYLLRVTKRDDSCAAVLGLMAFNRGARYISPPDEEIVLHSDTVYLRLEVDGGFGVFLYSEDDREYRPFPRKLAVSILSDEYDRYGFTGAVAGLFCADLQYESAYADFSFFNYDGDTGEYTD